jgi:GLPGLI family protein
MRLSIVLTLISFIANAQTYKAIYIINFISNLDTKAVRTERAFLIIKNNQESSYASENTYKQDSIRRLVKEGVLTAQEVMNDKYPKTSLNHFVQKNYSEQSMTIANLIASDNYIYT